MSIHRLQPAKARRVREQSAALVCAFAAEAQCVSRTRTLEITIRTEREGFTISKEPDWALFNELARAISTELEGNKRTEHR